MTQHAKIIFIYSAVSVLQTEFNPTSKNMRILLSTKCIGAFSNI